MRDVAAANGGGDRVTGQPGFADARGADDHHPASIGLLDSVGYRA